MTDHSNDHITQVALSNCDKEPVHIPGRIQSFGSMLGFDLKTGTLRYYAENIGTLFPELSSLTFGTHFEKVFANRYIVHAIRGGLGLPTLQNHRERLGSFELGHKHVDIGMYTSDGTFVLELDPIPPPSGVLRSPIHLVQDLLSTLTTNQGISPLLDSAVQAFRHLTGFDRVMAYKFLDDGAGEVVAEAKAPGLEPFQGLRYPASDIPQQVRQIMLRMPFRTIADTNAPATSIIAQDDTPLDMTLGHLRGVSPIHIEYLGNMGVQATMNVSIRVRNRLWGLFAFHHELKKVLTPDERSTCEIFGQLVSMLIQQELENEGLQARQRVQSLVRSLSTRRIEVDLFLAEYAEPLMKALHADGICVKQGEEYVMQGQTPTKEITQKLIELPSQGLLALDSLKRVKGLHTASLNTTAGALVMKISADTYCIFFRQEVLQHIRWAGDTQKKIEYGPNGPRLRPRSSFEEYKETVANRSVPWSAADVSVASELRHALWRVLLPKTEGYSLEWEQERRLRDLLIAELNHRVRNTLSLVNAIAQQSKHSATSVEHYVNTLEKRINSLSTAHSFIGTGLQWARIQDFITMELQPYKHGDFDLHVEGEDVAVRADIAPIIALLFHELSTNSVKYGALSSKKGSLSITWHRQDGGYLIQWHEQLEAPIAPPTRKGFGLTLIERAIDFECKGHSSIRFEEERVSIDIWLPLELIMDVDSEPSSSETLQPPKPLEKRTLSYQSVLIAEDNFLLAMELEKQLQQLGCKEIDIHANTTSLKQALERHTYDVALLDIQLGNETSFEVGLMLLAKGTKIVFLSGYERRDDCPPALRQCVHLIKPVDKVDLLFALSNQEKSTP
tara:strand:+ start:6581 stop:9112 length:2532 start_codon:yes stop_codon:yes gene_type:complete